MSKTGDDGAESCRRWDCSADSLAEWASEGEQNAVPGSFMSEVQGSASRRDGGRSFVTKVQHMRMYA